MGKYSHILPILDPYSFNTEEGCNILGFREQIQCAIKKTDYSSELHCTEDSLEITEHVTVTCHQPTSCEIAMMSDQNSQDH